MRKNVVRGNERERERKKCVVRRNVSKEDWKRGGSNKHDENK